MHPSLQRTAAAAAVFAASAHAQTTPAPAVSAAAGQTITIQGRHYDNAVGTSDAASQGVIGAALLKSRPAQRPGEVLEFVPGVIVTQHSGDGKANQYFLRGFNLDHGTDFATSVDGMPVNMPSHGHGQGYTDLNFLLPELVQRIEYRKGPYFAKGGATGDFASAGAADIVYRKRLDAPFGQLTVGERGYQRGVAGASFDVGGGLTVLGALELGRNDGPWSVPERLKKSNGVFSVSGGDARNGFSVSLLGYDASWTSTDQVPQRLIDAGSYQGRPFGRFDSLDPTDGGSTTRSSLSAKWHGDSERGRTRITGYAMRYRLELDSNFTYALERPAEGDQFKQRDRRSVYGLTASHAFSHKLGGLDLRSEFGAQLRHDRIEVGLYDTVARNITAVTREDRIRETLLGVYGQSALQLTPKLRAVLGLRADRIDNRVDALSLAANGGNTSDTQLSPKLSLVAGPYADTEFFFNAGRGLHSNDARGTTTTLDPKCLAGGQPAADCGVDRVPALVASQGYEIGARTEALPGLQSSIALWKLDFDSELVYVGDAGATEASRASKRYGVEFNNRYTPLPWLLFDADFAWTHARFDNGDRIPNALDRVASVAVTLRELGPWSASLQWRYMGSGALTEDNQVRSTSSLNTNLRLARRLGRKAELTLDVFNLADRKINDIQYFYGSQVPGELAAQEDRHVHPAEPRTVRVTLRYDF